MEVLTWSAKNTDSIFLLGKDNSIFPCTHSSSFKYVVSSCSRDTTMYCSEFMFTSFNLVCPQHLVHMQRSWKKLVLFYYSLLALERTWFFIDHPSLQKLARYFFLAFMLQGITADDCHFLFFVFLLVHTQHALLCNYHMKFLIMQCQCYLFFNRNFPFLLYSTPVKVLFNVFSCHKL